MTFHHRKLPGYSTLLSGHTPPDEVGFKSDRLQIWYNNSTETWHDEGSHAHQESDECFIVLRGTLIVEVEGTQHTVQAGEFCCFPRGMFHSVVEAQPPFEILMIRAPSVNDKVYQS